MLSVIVQATLQGTVLAATSNVLAQAINCYNKSVSRQHAFQRRLPASPFNIDYIPVIHFALYALFNTPPNFLWLEYLENAFPGEVNVSASPSTVTSRPDDSKVKGSVVHSSKTSGKSTLKQRSKKKTSVRNVIIKLVLDQTIAALVNTILFISVLGAFKGLDNRQILEKIRQETFPLMMAATKVWPLVSLLNFTIIPPAYRLVFANAIGLVWGIFLSLFAT